MRLKIVIIITWAFQVPLLESNTKEGKQPLERDDNYNHLFLKKVKLKK